MTLPDHLAKSGREEILAVLAKPTSTPWRSVWRKVSTAPFKTREEAKRCAALFQKHAKELDGVIVTLPNFGDERAIRHPCASSWCSGAGTGHAGHCVEDDDYAPARQFLRQVSACNNLKQYRIPYSLTNCTRSRSIRPNSRKLQQFFLQSVASCAGPKDLRALARSARRSGRSTPSRLLSEKLLEANGISVETLGPERSARPHQPHERQCSRRPRGHRKICQHERRPNPR